MATCKYELRTYLDGNGRETVGAFADGLPIAAPRAATPSNVESLRTWLQSQLRKHPPRGAVILETRIAPAGA